MVQYYHIILYYYHISVSSYFIVMLTFIYLFIYHFLKDYGCALQKEILIQGRIYVSLNHICFHANIFGWTTNVSTIVKGYLIKRKDFNLIIFFVFMFL